MRHMLVKAALCGALCGAAMLPAGPAMAQDIQEPVTADSIERRAADVAAVLRGEAAANEVFAKAFLAAVPEAQLRALTAQMEGQFGALQGLEGVEQIGPDSAVIALRFDRMIVRGPMTIGEADPRLVVGLLLNDYQPVDDDVDTIRANIAALPGVVSVLYAPLDAAAPPTFAINSDRQMAIGSTFKLYILAALARSIASGERKWSDVASLDRKSLPSGQMQNWPEGSPVTLHSLASMMISISDNTATDVLLHEVGVDAVEAELIGSGHADPDRTLPFLSTLQMFALKGTEDNLRKYEAASEVGQRRILDDFEDDFGGDPKLITPPRFTEPAAIDTVEWFASGDDLRKLMRTLADLPDPTARQIMSINTALPKARRDEWRYTGYKGGSEPGVLNLTWLLQDKAERWYVLAMSWNNTEAAVSHSDFELLAQRILPLAF